MGLMADIRPPMLIIIEVISRLGRGQSDPWTGGVVELGFKFN